MDRILSTMETKNTAPLERGRPVAAISSESAYEDSWYRVLKRLSEEGGSDDAYVGGDDGRSR